MLTYMDEDIKKELQNQRELLQAIYQSVEKTNTYFKWTLIITVFVVVFPAVGLLFVIPQFISSYSNGLGL